MFKFEKLLLYIKNRKSLYFQMSNLAAVYFIFIEVFFLFNVLFFYNIIEYRLLKTKEAPQVFPVLRKRLQFILGLDS